MPGRFARRFSNVFVAGRPALKLYPELSIAALKNRTDKGLILWYELRAHNSTGSHSPGEQWSSGRVLLTEDSHSSLASTFGYSIPTLYRLLKLGNGKYWVIYRCLGFRILYLYGLGRVAKSLQVQTLSRPVQVEGKELKGRQSKRAWLYASFFKPEGCKSKPISRDSLADATGIQRRQQRRYEKVARVRRVANFAVWQNQAGVIVPLVQQVAGKSRQYDKPRRLGNTYYSRAKQANRGMAKRVAPMRSLQRDEARSLRRFFTSAKSLLQCSKRAEESYLLVDNRERIIKGRMEWGLIYA